MKLTTGQRAWCLFGIASFAFWLQTIDLQTSDFHSFYHAAQRLRGIDVPPLPAGDHPSLNPPTFTLLTAPLTVLPIAVAFTLWTLGGIAALVDALRRIHARHRLPPAAWPWIVGGLTATMPALLIWVEGQVTWYLLWLVTRAWLAESPQRSGVWLGLAIALKPPLALMAILLPWPIWLVAGGLSASVSALTILVIGWGPWADWLALGPGVHWLGIPHNVSIWGATVRLWIGQVYGVPFSILPWWLIAPSALLLAAVAGWVLRQSDDRRWGHALWWSLLASPAGWTYYLPLALGPMLGSWPTSRLGQLGLGLLAVPMPILVTIAQPSQDLGTRTFGMVYALGAWCLWIAWTRSGVSYRDGS